MRKLVIAVGTTAAILGLVTPPAAAEHQASASPSTIGPLFTVTIPGRWFPPTQRFIPRHWGNGDREFNGNGPDVFATATLVGVGTNELRVRLFMDAVETKWDWTEARGNGEWLLYQAPVGQCVRSVSLGRTEELSYRDTDHAADVFGQQVVGSFVRTWDVMGDTPGDEAGTETGAAVFTHTFTADVQPC
jgi:hypothetical protein